MANGNSSKFWQYVLVFILFLCILVFVYVGYNYVKNKSQPNYETIEEQQETIDEYKDKVKLLADAVRNERIIEWGKYIMILGTICFIAFLVYKYKLSKDKEFLTLDQAKAKGKVWMKEFYGIEPLWCVGSTIARVEGEAKLYFLMYGWELKMQGQPIPYGATKILCTMNNDWDCARIEDIPQGVTMNEAINMILSERDNKGYPIVRTSTISEMMAVKEFAEKKKNEDAVIKDLGIQTEGGN